MGGWGSSEPTAISNRLCITQPALMLANTLPIPLTFPFEHSNLAINSGNAPDDEKDTTDVAWPK